MEVRSTLTKSSQIPLQNISYSLKTLQTVSFKPKFYINNLNITLKVRLWLVLTFENFATSAAILSSRSANTCTRTRAPELPSLGKMYYLIWHSDDVTKRGGTTGNSILSETYKQILDVLKKTCLEAIFGNLSIIDSYIVNVNSLPIIIDSAVQTFTSNRNKVCIDLLINNISYFTLVS